MIWRRQLERHLSLYLVATLVLPAGAFASTTENASLQATSTTQQQQTPTPHTSDPTAPTADTSTTTPTPAAPPTQSTQQNTVPLGTAAAPATNVEGVPASASSGAAIAPGKQKRIRRFSVRTALVVGAVIAVGVVVGLTAASPSHP